ncbi:uncharacterized protein ACRADG_010403 isoform 1-T1 [Cochliomyia hominivorax]
MSSSRVFVDYFNHLLEYQNQLLPDNKLCKDYIIIYNYLMDLLQKNDILVALLVRQEQKASNINGDILLDLSKLFDLRAFTHEPFICLNLRNLDNNHLEQTPYAFYNNKGSLNSAKITDLIWLTLNKGLNECGSFVRGYQGDIYELSLCHEDYNEFNRIRLNAYNEDATININLRILLKFLNSKSKTTTKIKFYPSTDLNKEWLVLVPRQQTSMFEISLPKLENEMKKSGFKLIMILRLLRFLFEKHKNLKRLNMDFLESIVYSEFMMINKKRYGYDYIAKGILTHICFALKYKKCPHFWNTHFNLMKSFRETHFIWRSYNDFNVIFSNFNKLKMNEALTHEEFFEFFDFKMEPFTYEVDQFGIFKSY